MDYVIDSSLRPVMSPGRELHTAVDTAGSQCKQELVNSCGAATRRPAPCCEAMMAMTGGG